jgi:hypothetical protein
MKRHEACPYSAARGNVTVTLAVSGTAIEDEAA